MGFTGYLLPWDQTAYWATVVGINLNGTAPFAGPWLAQFPAAARRSAPTRSAKWYALHMLLIPGALDRGADRHPPVSRGAARDHVAALVEGRRWTSAGGAEADRSPRGPRSARERGQVMARSLGEQNREWYARYKDDVKKEGKAFFPKGDAARHGQRGSSSCS